MKAISYYRLKQTDYNGAYTYSNLEMVDFKINRTVKILMYIPILVTGDRYKYNTMQHHKAMKVLASSL